MCIVVTFSRCVVKKQKKKKQLSPSHIFSKFLHVLLNTRFGSASAPCVVVGHTLLKDTYFKLVFSTAMVFRTPEWV